MFTRVDTELVIGSGQVRQKDGRDKYSRARL